MTGKIVGSMMLVAGTAIGAGMLAIPIVTAGLGFAMSTFLLVLCWAVMTLTGFIILHVNMAFQEHSNFSTMAAKTIGKMGGIFTWIFYSLLLYALVAAYMTGGASLLGHSTSLIFHAKLPQVACVLLFTVIFGVFVYFGTRSVDYANRILITLKIGAFILMLIFLFPHIHVENLLTSSKNSSSWFFALPILITSFGYQNVIPNLRDYLHSDVKKLKTVIFFGALIPLIVYIFWEIVVLGTAPELSHKEGLIELINRLSSRLQSPFLAFVVNFFTDVAITTSFLGVSMSLFHLVRDKFHLNRNRTGEKGLAALITFLPPFCFATFYPEGFILALSYAGVFVVVLLVLIPVWMALQIKKKKMVSLYPFRLHWSAITGLVIFSLLVIGAQFYHHV